MHTWRAPEREPITGVWGPSPQRGSSGGCGAGAPRWGSGGEADEVFVFKQ